jgi:3-isopropylmalate/(R)-2-methylmalate dehydratase small subunit
MTVPWTTLTSPYAVVDERDIDTDQIIPARWLKTTDRTGLGDGLFADRRWLAGTPANAHVLVAGANFGCGSSREHAVWALQGRGFRAVIAPSFADIFRGNALKNGLLPVALSADAHAALVATPAARRTITIDLASQEVTLPGGAPAAFAVDPFARHCLLHGIDELGYLLSFVDDIRAHELRHDQPR